MQMNDANSVQVLIILTGWISERLSVRSKVFHVTMDSIQVLIVLFHRHAELAWEASLSYFGGDMFYIF